MSIPYKVLNQEFRDQTAVSLYPLSDIATTGNDDLYLGPGFLLDALIYILGDYEAPFFISSLTGGYGTDRQLKITLQDNNLTEICSGVMDMATDVCFLTDTHGTQAGTLVYDVNELQRIIGLLKDKSVDFTVNETELSAGACFAVKSGRGIAVVTDDSSYTGAVELLGANGVHFTLEDGTVAVNLYGEESTTGRVPIKTINLIDQPHFWLCAHPDSALRVVTDNNILIGHKRDL